MTRILCPHLGQPDSGSCSLLSFSEGLCVGGGGGAFNQHDKPCHPLRAHTHTRTDTHMWEWAYAEGQWAGRCAIISPSLHGKLLTHVEGASFDLQKVHPHYAKVVVSLCAGLSEAWRRNQWRKCRDLGGREGRNRHAERDTQRFFN